MWAAKSLVCAILAVEGFLLLRPDGALVRAAQKSGDHQADAAESWFRNSPVHMGCSIASCTRAATRLATYRQLSPRGATWRAYGFCEFHDPPAVVDGLVYRLGRPKVLGYDVPLTPLWAQVYFLLGAFGFSIWSIGIWRYAASELTTAKWIGFSVVHAATLAALWKY
jgi:hypothetical protein